MSVRSVRNFVFNSLPAPHFNPDVLTQEKEGEDAIVIRTRQAGTRAEAGPVYRVLVQEVREPSLLDVEPPAEAQRSTAGRGKRGKRG